MPKMIIRTEGAGGAFADVFGRRPTLELPEHTPIRVETLDAGMDSGLPSVSFILEFDAVDLHDLMTPRATKTGAVVLAQTSVKLFQMAAFTTIAKYGDLTKGAFTGILEGSTATLTLSKVEKCTNCHSDIPGSCKYCPECGGKL